MHIIPTNLRHLFKCNQVEHLLLVPHEIGQIRFDASIFKAIASLNSDRRVEYSAAVRACTSFLSQTSLYGSAFAKDSDEAMRASLLSEKTDRKIKLSTSSFTQMLLSDTHESGLTQLSRRGIS